MIYDTSYPNSPTPMNHHHHHSTSISSAKDFIDEALSIAMHAMRSSVHSTLGSSPGSHVFNRDMFLNVPLIADWEAITKKREHLVNENLMRENRRRRQYDYQPNQLVLKKNHNPRKLVVHTVLQKCTPMVQLPYKSAKT